MYRKYYILGIFIVGAVLSSWSININNTVKNYGDLVLSSELEGLHIYIDEKRVGVTSRKPQSFQLPQYGVYGKWEHEVVVQKEIDATQEYFFRLRFAFNQYIDVEEHPVKRIALTNTPPENVTYPPINFILSPRLKPDVLARQTGLIKGIKLKHNHAWEMAQDKDRIYVLTKADTDLYRKSRNENVEGEFIEVYDKDTLAFIDQKQLSWSNDTFSTYCSIAVSEDTIYIGDRLGYISRLNKHNLKLMSSKEQPFGNSSNIMGLLVFQEYLVVYNEESKIAVYQKDKFLYLIDEKMNFPTNIEEIHDYDNYNRIDSILIHKGILYATNFRGFINAYTFKDGQFYRQINTITFDKDKGYATAGHIEAVACYQDRYLYFSMDLDNLLIVDTQTGTISRIATLFPENIVYDDFFKENIDLTKKTDIYKMVFYRNFLIFTEVNALHDFVYAYDLEQGKIVHTFQGHRGAITELFLNDDRLTGVSVEGILYRWDLQVLNQDSNLTLLWGALN